MKIAIIGTGAYGLALGSMFSLNNNDIIMWSKFENEVNDLKTNRKFKGIDLPKSIKYTTDMELCVKKSDLIVIAIPVAFIKSTIEELKKYYHNTPILIASSISHIAFWCMFHSFVVYFQQSKHNGNNAIFLE